jgi:hypothetical protein
MRTKKQNKKKVKAPARRQRRKGRPMNKLAKMIRDPCNAELMPGFHSTDEGILSRLKTRTGFGNTNTAGFCLWCPSYASDNGPGNRSNVFVYTTPDPSVAPLNTVAQPFGGGAGSGDPNGISLPVGASAFATSSTVADQRSIGACMRIEYIGRMDAASGQIALLTNLPAEALLDNGSGTVSSVDALFNRAAKVTRFGADNFEVVYRPDTSSNLFKTERDGVITVGTPAASSSVITSESLRFGPRLIGFAWRKIPTAQDIILEFYQNIEWRPNTTSGFVSTLPKQIHSPGYMENVLKYLDDNYPGWQTTLVGTAANVVSKMAFGGTPTGPRFRAVEL